MAKNSYHVGAFAVLGIILLRIAIGVQFMAAGLEKFDPSFTSAPLLRSSVGPFEDYYKSMAPLPHDWDNLAHKPWPEGFNYDDQRRYWGPTKDDPEMKARESKTKTDDLGYIPYPTDAYGPWIAQVAEDWKAKADGFKKLPGLTDGQRTKIDEISAKHYRNLAYYAEASRYGFEEWHHERSRLEQMKEDRKDNDAPYMYGRIVQKQSELNGLWRPLLAGMQTQEDLLKTELMKTLEEKDLESATLYDQAERTLESHGKLPLINNTVKWFTLIAGLCLIFGLFTRLASIACAGFLLSVMSTQPMWVEGISDLAGWLFPYQGIEVCALLVLAGLGAGRWAGLDGALFGGGGKED